MRADAAGAKACRTDAVSVLAKPRPPRRAKPSPGERLLPLLLGPLRRRTDARAT
jgi:hypothetical protein